MEGSVITACVIAIGDELLCGRTVDTNSGFIQRQLQKFGIEVNRVIVVHDNKHDIAQALDTSDQKLIFITGGLGPTHDDITVESIATWAKVPVVIDKNVEADLKSRCSDSNTEYHKGMAKQAMTPQGMNTLKNPVGSAPGQVGEFNGTTIVLLPGVPAELKGLWPLVEDALGLNIADTNYFRFRTTGLSEPKISKMCEKIRSQYSGLVWSWWLSKWGVDVQVSGPDSELVKIVKAKLRHELGDSIFASGDKELNQQIGELLVESGKTVSVAESCTAGMVGAVLTEIPGASAYFVGGVLTYSNEIKTQLLNVPVHLLEKSGAVSQECATAMAVNCREKFNTDYAISVTGISGPDGGTESKPVGTTWIAVASHNKCKVKKFRFLAHRQRSRELAVAMALTMLRQEYNPAG
jgi:nicotinamide-nucleotide amidase